MPLEQPQSIRTVFFDAGLTLLRPYPSNAKICQKACQKLDLHVHLHEIEQALDVSKDYYQRYINLHRHTWSSEQAIEELWTGYYTNMLRPFVEEHDEQRLHQLVRAIMDEFYSHTSWQPYEDVRPVLEVLKKQGYTLGVISDWGSVLSTILLRLDLNRYFDCLLVSASVREAKPSPTLYAMALERSNSIADYALHIGDSYINDVLGARAVGITPVLLDRERKLSPDDVDCALVHSLSELLDLLEVSYP
jgi:REG-2-like HAD superfamily hydrolase